MFHIDPGSIVPPFEQLRTQITKQRADGTLPAGHKLPTVRFLAAELGLAPNTVARTYRELEALGVIETRGRAGSFVVGTSESAAKAAKALTRQYLDDLAKLGFPAASASGFINAASAGLDPAG